MTGDTVAPETHAEPGRELPVIAEVDVLVVGGGPAGVGAAVGAARTGASVFLVEEMGAFGGMWTQGLVITLAGYNSWLQPYGYASWTVSAATGCGARPSSVGPWTTTAGCSAPTRRR